MNILKSIFGWTQKDLAKNVMDALASGGDDSLYPQYSKQAAVAMFIGRSPWLYTCANINARAASSVPIRLLIKDKGNSVEELKKICPWNIKPISKECRRMLKSHVNGPSRYVRKAIDADTSGWVEVTDHPVLTLLTESSRVNPDTGTNIHLSRFIDLQVTGEWFLRVLSDKRGVPFGLQYVPSSITKTLPSSDPNKMVAGYEYGTKEKTIFTTEEIIHGMLPSPDGNMLQGRSIAEGCWTALQWMELYCQYETILFKNMGAAKVFAKVKGSNEDTLKRAAAYYSINNTGMRNAGKVCFHPDAYEFYALQMSRGKDSLSDDIPMAYDNKLNEIAGCFGIPTSKLKTNESNLASSYTGEYAFKTGILMYLLREDEQRLNEGLLWRYGIEDDAVLVYDSTVVKDENTVQKTIASTYQAGIITLNEARAEIGYEAIDGGDAFISNPSVPIDEVQTTELNTSNGNSEESRSPRGSNLDEEEDDGN